MGKNGPVHIIIYKTGENGPTYSNSLIKKRENGPAYINVYQLLDTIKEKGSDRDSYNMFNKGWESFSKPPSLFQHYSMLE